MNCVRFCFGTVCDFLFVYEMPLELLNGFVPNSQRRRVWSFTWASLNVKVKVTRDKKRHFLAILAVCVRFVFGKISFASRLRICLLVVVCSRMHY